MGTANRGSTARPCPGHRSTAVPSSHCNSTLFAPSFWPRPARRQRWVCTNVCRYIEVPLTLNQLFISDLNNVANPFRLGATSAARADDFESVDWNKKVPHILATGSSGGFVTVWDVKAKKESLTLNVLGRKPVSAVAWDPQNVRGRTSHDSKSRTLIALCSSRPSWLRRSLMIRTLSSSCGTFETRTLRNE